MKIAKADFRILLQKHFPSLSEPALQEAIVEDAKLVNFKEGQLILDFGTYINMVPLVLSGCIKIVREDDEGKEIFLYYLLPGEACSMSFSCCRMDKKSEIKAIAEEDTLVIGIPTPKIDNWIGRFVSWKNFVMQTYNDRMYSMVKVIDSIAFSNMDDRLLNYLKQRKDATKTSHIYATHQEIANDLNASREAISRLLKKLEKLGKVKLGRNVLTLTV